MLSALTWSLFGLFLVPGALGAEAPERLVEAAVDRRADSYRDAALQLWRWAEVGYREERSSALLQEILREAGFDSVRWVEPGDLAEEGIPHLDEHTQTLVFECRAADGAW